MECTACKEVIGNIESWVNANATLEEVEVLLDQLCEDLGGGFFTLTCENIVAYGVDEIYQYLQDNWTPAEVCAKIGMCDAFGLQEEEVCFEQKELRINHKFFFKEFDFWCASCKLLVSVAEYFVLNDYTIDEIETFLDQICQFFPDRMAAHCNAQINYNIDMIVRFIELNYGPEETCVLIDACDAENERKKEEAGDFWCESCYVHSQLFFIYKLW